MKFFNSLLMLLFVWSITGCGGGSGSSDNEGPASNNIAPVVNAGVDHSVNEGSPVSLAATASDTDGNIVSYLWEQIAGPVITLASNNQADSSFVAPMTGTDITIELRVTATDNQGAKATDNVVILVKAKMHLRKLSGHIMSLQENQPIAGARIQLGANHTVSANDGSYELSGFDYSGDTALIDVSKSGYAVQHKVLANQHFHISENYDIYLQPHDLVVAVDNESENAVRTDDGFLSLTLPSHAFTQSDGSAFNGEVTLKLTVIDPRSQMNAMPGDYTAVNDVGAAETLKSFGAFQIQAEDGNGVALKLDKTVEFEVKPFSVGGELPPEQVPFYQYNADSGKWQKSPVTLALNNLLTYRGSIAALGSYNVDMPVQTAIARGCVVDHNNQPLAGVKLSLLSNSVATTAETFSDSLGLWQLRIPEGPHFGIRADYALTRSEVYSLLSSSGDHNYSQCFRLGTPVLTAKLLFNRPLLLAMPMVTYKSPTLGIPVALLQPTNLSDLNIGELLAGFMSFDWQGRSATNLSVLKTGKGVFNYYLQYSEYGFDGVTAIEPRVVLDVPPQHVDIQGNSGRTVEQNIWHAFSVDFSGATPLITVQNKWVAEIE